MSSTAFYDIYDLYWIFQSLLMGCSTKHTGAHSKVILYDQSVRNQVGGAHNVVTFDL